MSEELRDLDLDNYRKSIEILAKTESKLIFKNSNSQHASIVLSNLINTSKDNVFIYDNDLSGDIGGHSEELLTSIIEFVKSKRILKIVINELGGENYFQDRLLELKERFANFLNISIASEAFKQSIKKQFGVDLNFAVGDKSKFRIEHDANGERKAFCSFNNTEYSKMINQLFENNVNSCQNI